MKVGYVLLYSTKQQTSGPVTYAGFATLHLAPSDFSAQTLHFLTTFLQASPSSSPRQFCPPKQPCLLPSRLLALKLCQLGAQMSQPAWPWVGRRLRVRTMRNPNPCLHCVFLSFHTVNLSGPPGVLSPCFHTREPLAHGAAGSVDVLQMPESTLTSLLPVQMPIRFFTVLLAGRRLVPEGSGDRQCASQAVFSTGAFPNP